MTAMPRRRDAWSALKRALVVVSVVGTCGFVGETAARAAEPCSLTTAAKADAEAGVRETIAAYNTALNGGQTGRCFRSTPAMECSCHPTASRR